MARMNSLSMRFKGHFGCGCNFVFIFASFIVSSNWCTYRKEEGKVEEEGEDGEEDEK